MENRSQKNHSRGTDSKGPNKKVIGLLGGVIGIGAAFFLYQHQQTVKAEEQGETTIKNFLKTLDQGKYDRLPQYLTADSLKKSGYTTKSVSQKYQTIFSAIGAEQLKPKNLTVEKAGDTYNFSYDLAMTTGLGKLKSQRYTGTLSADRKKINWQPDLIFPGMKGKDKISYQVDPATRGEITDRNGTAIAANGSVYQIGVVPKKLGSGTEKESAISSIAESLDLTTDDITQALDQGWVQADHFVPLKTVTSVPENLPAKAEYQTKTGRVYPLNEAAAQLIGYVGNVTADDIKKNDQLTSGSKIGRTGLERTYDKQLRGVDGGSLAILNSQGKQKQVLKKVAKKDGATIQLTIDSKAQQIAYDSLKGEPGASVVMAPKTGDLLVLASSPSYDPNKMTNGISQSDYDQYNNDQNQPFSSRFTTGYAPGSTFKTVTAAIGLDEGTLDPSDQLAISGLKWQKDASWGGYQVTRVTEKDPVDLKTALVNSDNIYMAQETLKLGEQKFRTGLNKFIFGEKLALPLAMDPAQISNKKTFNSDILLADTGYGQGQLLLNPIQQITTYSVFPNKGTLVYPRLVDGEKTKRKPDVIKEKTADLITEDLKAVVTDPDGTAHSLNDLNLPLAAKTGTAEIKLTQDEKGKENSFLYAFDTEKHGYSILEFLENKPADTSATDLSRDLLTYLNQNYQ